MSQSRPLLASVQSLGAVQAPSLVYRPQLPSSAAIARYLETLDATRWYANRGELVDALESRLAARLNLPKGRLLALASGSSALVAAILAQAGRASTRAPYCLCPGYTFVAGPQAAELCGYKVHLVDVVGETWTTDPDVLAKHPLIGECGLVLASAPYGRRFSQAAWQRFSERTGVPVVIDAAAGIERFAEDSADLFGDIPVVLSFHATKAFATGEGGAIVCSRSDLLLAAAAASNFGFAGARQASLPGFNGKMSEYHAAVGLAELDGWDDKRAALKQVGALYRRATLGTGLRVHASPLIGSNYVLLEASDAVHAAVVRAALARVGIDHRLWYGLGLHREPYFGGLGRDDLLGVDDLAPRLIGLPVAHDLDAEVVDAVVRMLPLP